MSQAVTLKVNEYALLDFGQGRKLERFGGVVIDRPAPQASGPRRLQDWDADWIYSGTRITDGEWQKRAADVPASWTLTIAGQRMHCRPGKGGQVGVYPEHATCWQWVRERLQGCDHIDELRVLNLFAGTGGATQAAVLAGARVTHVDAQASQLELARLNVGEEGARFIREDVMTFVERMVRKGERYHMVIMDPPSFGRAAKGKVWDIRSDLQPLIEYLPRLLTADCRGIWVSLHTRDMLAEDIADLINQVLPGNVIPLQLGTQTADGRVLEAGVAATWQDDSEPSTVDTPASP
ncbi:class I SAM-dependent methyltransferase [Sulfuriflexus sp.]|uniref:class I SAM-dependent methyltransferase n=1 Tax=Sulfuriflexus sp. TaxID=2015443 RepID=UPI0028CBC9C9|nr:class I SAM-dependent methyltransferase [Sulfuriflexus sp.]MDT8405554.1 class I SAM-dependent methyltransferase [Sulfuriflexus sp.]